MKAAKWIVLALALLQGGWFVFDGSRALIVGDYLTPSSGPRAGQLGPWSRVVSAAGLEPRSTLVKCAQLVLGIAWLAAVAALTFRPAAGWWFVFGCAVATLWYLPMGTVTGAIVIVLSLTRQLRSVK